MYKNKSVNSYTFNVGGGGTPSDRRALSNNIPRNSKDDNPNFHHHENLELHKVPY
jgi:hypothetical protein